MGQFFLTTEVFLVSLIEHIKNDNLVNLQGVACISLPLDNGFSFSFFFERGAGLLKVKI